MFATDVVLKSFFEFLGFRTRGKPAGVQGIFNFPVFLFLQPGFMKRQVNAHWKLMFSIQGMTLGIGFGQQAGRIDMDIFFLFPGIIIIRDKIQGFHATAY